MTTTATRERPILFNGDMVRAILAGRKTQTRRLAAIHPDDNPVIEGPHWYERLEYDRNENEIPGKTVYGVTFSNTGDAVQSPYGAPGDRLWVREAWRTLTDDFGFGAVQYRADSAVYRLLTTDGDDGDPCGVSGRTSVGQWSPDDVLPKWRPSIHMPRWACRVELEITGVRVERLQDISEDDAISEGIERTGGGRYWLSCEKHRTKGTRKVRGSAKHAFRDLWDSINGKRYGCAWADNPWVWAVEFRQAD